MQDRIATATGCVVSTEVEIRAEPSAAEGEYEVLLSYPIIDLAMQKLGTSASGAKVQLKLHLWASEAAKTATLRRIEEERKRQQAAEADARRAAQEAEDKKRYEELLQFWGKVLAIGFGATLIGIMWRRNYLKRLNAEGRRKLEAGDLRAALLCFKRTRNEMALHELGALCLKSGQATRDRDQFRELLSSALICFKEAKATADLTAVGNAILCYLDPAAVRSQRAEDLVPLLKVAREAFEAASQEQGLSRIAGYYLDVAERSNASKEVLELLGPAFQSLRTCKDATGLLRLGDIAMTAADRESQQSQKLKLTDLALKAFENGCSSPGIARCRAVRRAIGRQELASRTAEPNLKCSQMQRRIGLGGPMLIVSNSDGSSGVEVCLDYYDEYCVTSKGQLSLQLEPGVHHLKFAPGGVVIRSQGKLTLNQTAPTSGISPSRSEPIPNIIRHLMLIRLFQVARSA